MTSCASQSNRDSCRSDSGQQGGDEAVGRSKMADPKPRGRFVWYDLMTTDPSKAVEFYTRLAGWGTTEWEGPTKYTMWTNSSVPLGGVMQMPNGAGGPPHWLAYLSSPDIDATVKQATDLGAKSLV